MLASAGLSLAAFGCGGDGDGGSKTDAAVKLDALPPSPDLPLPTPDLPLPTPDLGAGGTGGMIVRWDTGAGGAVVDVGATIDAGRGDVADAPLSVEVGPTPDTRPIDVNNPIDVGNPVDVGFSNCRTATRAWAYTTPGLTNIAWAGDGTLLTGVAFYPATPTFGGKTLVNNGSADMLVAKLDPATGNAAWTFTAGDDKDQYVTSLAPASGGIGVIGTFKGTLDFDPVQGLIDPVVNTGTTFIDYLAGLSDAAGAALWAKKVNLGGGKLNAIAGSPGKDYVVVCGAAMNNAAGLGAVGTPGGANDVLVAALKVSDGTVLWAKLFGGALDQTCATAAMDAAGNVTLAGSFAGTLDFGLGEISAAPIASTERILWVAKLSGADGSALAAKAFGSTGSMAPYDVALDPQGNAVVVGMFNAASTLGGQPTTPLGTSDGFALKLDTSLAPVWARRFGGASGVASIQGVGVDSTGKLTVAGNFRGTLDGGPAGATLQSALPATLEVFVLALDGASGQTLCAAHFGDAASVGSGATAVAINSSGAGAAKDQIAIVGSFTKVIDFGGQTTALSASGSTNFGYLLEM